MLRILYFSFAYLRKQVWYGSKVYVVTLHTGFYTKSDGYMCLPGSGVAIHNNITSVAYEVESLKLGKEPPALSREILSDKFLQILHLWEASLAYALVFAILDALLDFALQYIT